MKISLIICTYNRSEILKATLPSLFELIIPNKTLFELIIVDNNSNDETSLIAENFVNDFIKSKSTISGKYCFERNQGLSHARNKGYEEATGDYIAYIDDECILPEQWLVEAKKIILTEKPAFLGGPYLGKYLPGSSSDWYKESFGDSYILQYNLSDGPMKGRFLSGGNMFVRRDVFEKIGIFDIELGMAGETLNYGEEVEFQKRYLNKFPDEVVWYDSKVFVWHCIRDIKMKISFLFKDALVRGESSAELQDLSDKKIRLGPIHLIFFIIKALVSALISFFQSVVKKKNFNLLLYNDYKNATWRDIGGAWYRTKRFLKIGGC